MLHKRTGHSEVANMADGGFLVKFGAKKKKKLPKGIKKITIEIKR